MLVIHWAKHNLTGRILKNGIRPSFRRGSEGRRNPKGVYVYPFSRSSTLSGNWHRNLKVWDGRLGNCNGFVFRLVPEDFPVIAGYWFFNRSDPDEAIIPTLDELAGLYGEFFSAEIVNMREQGVPYNWNDFEIIIPHRIDPSRFMKVLRDKGTEFFRPASFLYLAEMTRGIAAINKIDYCYAEVPVDIEPTFQHRTPLGSKSEKLPRHIFDFSMVTEPDNNELFAFSGQVHPELHGNIALVTEPTVYPGLRYIKSESPFFEFMLPVSHPGHDAFRGCSGAPIVDTKRRLVAIVSYGDVEKNTIYGVSLVRYKFALDFYCDELRPS